jgi:hypothetical protein
LSTGLENKEIPNMQTNPNIAAAKGRRTKVLVVWVEEFIVSVVFGG